MEELFEKMPVKKVYFKLAMPVVWGMVASMIYNLADTYFVAKTGNTKLIAGIAIGAPLFNFLIAVGDIFGLGASALISRLLGEKKLKDAASVSSFALYSAILTSLVLTGILLIFRDPIVKLLGATPETFAYARDFYSVIVLGSIFIVVSLVPGNIIRTEGLAMKSMIATISGTVLTIILDPIFIFGFGWGAKGVAFANVLGYILNTSLLLYFTHKDCQVATLDYRVMWISKEQVKQVLNIGFPASITNFMTAFGMAILNTHLAHYGSSQVAAMGIMQKIYLVVILVMVGFAFGAQPLIGYNYGAKNAQRFKEILRFDFMVQVIYATVLSIILMIFAPSLMKLFVSDSAIINEGTYMLRAFLCTTPFIGAGLVYTTVFQSTGNALGALTMSIARQGIVFLAVISLFSPLFGYHGVVWSQPVADVITFVIGFVIFKKLVKIK
ncbi:na+ driven multidrug efflux pump [Ligilactobacillus hayakitensis DSM 18933 = JCM 14209]|uniref:Multidrug export protein MepA n=1 Tax=Ligilactobacillus hayakitensis DSM 18933 = JCM 14209 TaxID=1423755 RepID=A0A0R1WP44_9LACO|nr:MATE family efflux transporter [Ligilactobacillus hayakitensis]KRM19518.1 na+ driven multidrug efflux pump [Ligilactobacillus hayakitensis DSM 18933 = JCM 14209]